MDIRYMTGAVYSSIGYLIWVWSSTAHRCDHPCYIDRCARTGRVLWASDAHPGDAPVGIDGLEFA